MATMNKPGSQDMDWYQEVTDNWTSIEENLIDKSVLTTKGDLLVATGLKTPSRLGVGSDGQFLSADSSQSTGLRWVAGDSALPADLVDILWGKKFFRDEGFLPSTKMFEYVGTPTAFAGTAGSATWTRDPGAYRASASGIGWYDLGAAKSKILFIAGNMAWIGAAIILTSSAPTGVDPDGYSVWKDSNGPGIWKKSGSYSRLDSSTGLPLITSTGMAFYYDDATNTLKLFIRMNGQWFLAQSATDSTFTTFRYVSLQSQGASGRFATPFACYAE